MATTTPAGEVSARRYWVAGQPAASADVMPVVYPYNDIKIADVCVPTRADVEAAIHAADASTASFARTSVGRRAEALDHVSRELARRADEVAHVVTSESGKPVRWSHVECLRASSVFRWAAEEARRFNGDVHRLDTEAATTGRLAIVRRFPRGPVLAITPFNFPLNLFAHKVAPALAVGAPVILKPAPSTPLSALLLGSLLAETDLPSGSWSVLPVRNETMPTLVQDARLPVVSFTGSVPVGWSIKEQVPRKHVTLELGGNAAAVVCADWNAESDLEWAAQRLGMFATYQGGQSCISVQRVYTHSSIYRSLVERLVHQLDHQVEGDPVDPATEVGPLINVEAARRVQTWVEDAVREGAELLTGGARDGSAYQPTLLAQPAAHSKVMAEEIFGPVLSIVPYDDIDDAFAQVNASRFGLHTGVFTHDLRTAFRAHAELAVGGVVIGDSPSFRADQLPYGGSKDSGVGREGVSAAMDDYTEPRTLIFTNVAL